MWYLIKRPPQNTTNGAILRLLRQPNMQLWPIQLSQESKRLDRVFRQVNVDTSEFQQWFFFTVRRCSKYCKRSYHSTNKLNLHITQKGCHKQSFSCRYQFIKLYLYTLVDFHY